MQYEYPKVDDDSNNINIPESEGMHGVEVSEILSNQFLKLLKINRVNIGSLKNQSSPI